MNNDLKKAIDLLHSSNPTCVLCSGDTVYSSDKRGVKPLLDWLDSEINMNGFCAADKVVGNAAAFLYVILGVKELYADVISKSALTTLEKFGVPVHYEKLVEYIINRAGTGKCPMEEAVSDVSDPADAVTAIRQRLKSLIQITE